MWGWCFTHICKKYVYSHSLLASFGCLQFKMHPSYLVHQKNQTPNNTCTKVHHRTLLYRGSEREKHGVHVLLYWSSQITSFWAVWPCASFSTKTGTKNSLQLNHLEQNSSCLVDIVRFEGFNLPKKTWEMLANFEAMLEAETHQTKWISIHIYIYVYTNINMS